MEALLARLLPGAGAAAWGVVSYAAVQGLLSPAAQAEVAERCPGAAAVLAAAFPYFAGDAPGNLSLYARGADYHRVLGEKLNTVCHVLWENYPEYLFFPGVDNSPLPEREIAWRAGIGLMGQNGLLILPPYGSYVFLGTVLTDAPLPLSSSPPASPCLGCGRCIAACPNGALSGGAFHPERCLSALTQKKGPLDPREEAALRRHALIWGCDTCQVVCPYNYRPQPTSLSPFTADPIARLSEEDLEGLTGRTFRAKYGDRAFAWRGMAVLRRNLALKRG